MKRIFVAGIALLAFAVLPQWAGALGLTAERNTPTRTGKAWNGKVAGGAKIYAGAMVALDISGYATNAADVAGLIVIGRCEKTVDNSAGADGALNIEVARGIFGWKNGGDITIANIGDIAYVYDNQTVSCATNGSNNILAGQVVDLDGTYVWVDTFRIAPLAGSFTTLAASGAATLSSTLTVSGASRFVNTRTTGYSTNETGIVGNGTLDIAGSSHFVKGVTNDANVSVGAALLVTGPSRHIKAVTNDANVDVGANLLVTGTSLFTGATTNTAAPGFTAKTAVGSGVATPIANVPTAALTNGWVYITAVLGGTNVVIPALLVP